MYYAYWKQTITIKLIKYSSIIGSQISLDFDGVLVKTHYFVHLITVGIIYFFSTAYPIWSSTCYDHFVWVATRCRWNGPFPDLEWMVNIWRLRLCCEEVAEEQAMYSSCAAYAFYHIIMFTDVSAYEWMTHFVRMCSTLTYCSIIHTDKVLLVIACIRTQISASSLLITLLWTVCEPYISLSRLPKLSSTY